MSASVDRSSMNTQRLWRSLVSLPAFAVMVVGLWGCGGSEERASDSSQASAGPPGAEGRPEEPQDTIAVRVTPVKRQALSSLYTTSATLRAEKQATVTARTRGVLEKLMVEEGNYVEGGAPLAQLENAEQTIDFEMARATRDTRVREYERIDRLFAQKLVSEEEYETARRAAEEAKQSFSRAELDLSRTLVRAPFGGRILTRHLDVGATVSDGTPLYDLADLNPLYADVNVPEVHVGRLSPGQTVRLTTGEPGGEVLAGIERIAPLVDRETGTVKVTLAVKKGSQLRPGTFVRVAVVTDTHDDALVVPRSAMVAEGRRWHLFRLEPDGKTVKMLEVEPGFEEGELVEIQKVLSDGETLSEETSVVYVGASALNDGAVVQVMELEEEPEEPAAEAAEG